MSTKKLLLDDPFLEKYQKERGIAGGIGQHLIRDINFEDIAGHADEDHRFINNVVPVVPGTVKDVEKYLDRFEMFKMFTLPRLKLQ